MSICIPTTSCGINGNYISAERGVTFVTSDTDTCFVSEADIVLGAEGSKCASNTFGCDAGLVCALNIDDGAGNDLMSICIPSASCATLGTYLSPQRGITFATSGVPGSCIQSLDDSFLEGEDCSKNIDGCATGLVCAIDVLDGSSNNHTLCIPASLEGTTATYTPPGLPTLTVTITNTT